MLRSEHLRVWFTPQRRFIISCAALDRLAGRPIGTLSRFLDREKHVTLTYGTGLADYYPFLALLGYQPPKDTDTSETGESST
jgi:hypothetical protein